MWVVVVLLRHDRARHRVRRLAHRQDHGAEDHQAEAGGRLLRRDRRRDHAVPRHRRSASRCRPPTPLPVRSSAWARCTRCPPCAGASPATSCWPWVLTIPCTAFIAAVAWWLGAALPLNADAPVRKSHDANRLGCCRGAAEHRAPACRQRGRFRRARHRYRAGAQAARHERRVRPRGVEKNGRTRLARHPGAGAATAGSGWGLRRWRSSRAGSRARSCPSRSRRRAVLAATALAAAENEALKRGAAAAARCGRDRCPRWRGRKQAGGLDSAAIQTRATPFEGGYKLTGVKRFIAGAAQADAFLVSARAGEGIVLAVAAARDRGRATRARAARRRTCIRHAQAGGRAGAQGAAWWRAARPRRRRSAARSTMAARSRAPSSPA